MAPRRPLVALIALLGGGAMAAAASAGIPGSAPMPKPMKAWLYRDPGFTGPMLMIDTTRLFVETPWPVRSIRIAGDGKWQMCSDSLFDGRCVMVTRDSPSLATDHQWTARVGSLRAICATTGRD